MRPASLGSHGRILPSLADGQGKMAVSTIYTHFHFKATRLHDLQNKTKDKPVRIEVVKVVELTEKQFRLFPRICWMTCPLLSKTGT